MRVTGCYFAFMMSQWPEIGLWSKDVATENCFHAELETFYLLKHPI